MDKHRQRSREMSIPDPVGHDAGGDPVVSLFVVACFSTILALTLTEQYDQLPAGLAAIAAAWWIMRL